MAKLEFKGSIAPFALAFVWLFAVHQARAQTENIFTPPPSEKTLPAFSNPQAKAVLADKLGQKIPGWQQIRVIPSLSGSQRKKLRELYKGDKDDLKSMGAELKEIRGKLKAARGASGKGRKAGINDKGQAAVNLDNAQSLAELHAQAQSLAAKIKEKRGALWQKARTILSEEQVRELDEMRTGKLGVRPER